MTKLRGRGVGGGGGFSLIKICPNDYFSLILCLFSLCYGYGVASQSGMPLVQLQQAMFGGTFFILPGMK